MGVRTTSCLLACLLMTGCMVRRGGLAGTTQRELGRSTRLVQAGDPELDIEQEGDRLLVRARQRCSRVTHRDIEVTQHFGRELASPGWMVAMGIGAVGFGVAGGIFAGNVPGYPPMSAMGPLDEGLSQETALVGGVILIGVSAALTAVTLGNLFRLPGTDDETSRQTAQSPGLGPPTACEPAIPFSGAVVALDGPPQLSLGRTDSAGYLSADVGLLAEPSWVIEQPSSVPVLVGGQPTGHRFDLRQMRADLDERLWARARVTHCVSARSADDCQGVDAYLALFPSGQHAAEARRIRGETQQRLAEAAAWREEQARLEAERRAAEDVRRREEEERRYREEQERWEREAARAREESERRREEAAAASERRARHAECRRRCIQTCSGDGACVQACVRQQCR